jgi:hypothetical protein
MGKAMDITIQGMRLIANVLYVTIQELTAKQSNSLWEVQ